MANRLAGATSPYLAQHKDNPVQWYEWGPEAFATARTRDVPVLLSIGYAACHWCHVMAHESFEDAATATQMNEHFVNVKVDREERPDVDAVYMAATQALTGHGGWPMTVFLTPAGTPFYAGTYFPPVATGQFPAFRQVLAAVSQTWTTRRDEVENAAAQIAESLAQQAVPPHLSSSGGGAARGASGPPEASLLADAAANLLRLEDGAYGGFGGAPKFPPSMNLEFLVRHGARLRLAGQTEPADAVIAAAGRTLRAMAHSGMYDQLAGGFARYAVDARWVVPHFEKMLYDNALLARVYLHWWRLTGEPTGARIAQETCDWMCAALGTPYGGLASSLDADTPVPGADGVVRGVEGHTYVWTPGQLRDLLGEADGAWVAELTRVTPSGTFERGSSTLQLDQDVWADPESARRWAALRARLLQHRTARPQPERDDKVVTAWNGLAIAALAETGAVLGRPDLVEAAQVIADLMLAVHLDAAGRLCRASRNGVAGRPAGVLEDYGDLAEGLIALHAVTGEGPWLELTGVLLETVLARFTDPAEAGGAFYDTASDATDAQLAAVRRPQEVTDNAYPSGWSAATGALLSYAALTGSARHRAAAEKGLALVSAAGARAPRAFGWALSVAEAALDGPREVAVVGSQRSSLRDRLHAVALAGSAPGLVVSVGEPDAEGVPLLAGRAVSAGPSSGTTTAPQALAFVCRNMACDAPTAEPGALARAVGARLDTPRVSPR